MAETSSKGRTAQTSGQFAPIQSIDLVKEMVDQVREQILSGKFGSDGLLPPEAELSEQFGVSRTVAREAMRTLRAQGLVDVSRGRRPRVRPADPQVVADGLHALVLRSDAQLEHLAEIRRPLELEAAALAATNATVEQRQAMAVAIDEQIAAKSLSKQVAADTHFHNLLAESTGNPMFSLLLSTIAPLLNESRRRTISRVGPDRAVQGHKVILAALESGDTETARDAMGSHLRMADEDLAKANAANAD